jgi:hypothetical protein
MPRFYSDPPDLKTIGGRLRWAREHYVTPDGGSLESIRAAAKFFGWNENTYKSHEQGLRQAQALKRDHAERYARAYGVAIDWLVLGLGEPYRKRA